MSEGLVVASSGEYFWMAATSPVSATTLVMEASCSSWELPSTRAFLLGWSLEKSLIVEVEDRVVIRNEIRK
jgi:hypothetical protein